MASQYVDLPVEGGGTGVSSLNGETGAVTLVGGTGITVTPAGQNITIASTVTGGITQLTGDVLAGPGSGSQAATLASVNVTPGSFGDATHVGGFTVNAKGLVTASVSTTIQITESQVTNLVTDLAAKQSATLTNTHILVGNGSNVATDVALSGDATLANTGAITIANSAVTNAKLANMADQTFKGNVSGGSAAPSDLTVAQMKTALSLSGTNSGDVTLGATATSGGMTLAAQVLSMSQSSGSTNGWLSSTDWTNFSNTVQQTFNVKNTSGSTISKGQCVYITGFDGGTGLPTASLAKSDAAATMPSIGLVSAATIANNATGSIQVAGLITNLNTSGLTAGQVAYVSTTTAGSLQTTYPSISGGVPPIAQMVGIVVVSDATVGSIYVVAQQPDQLQNGTSANNFYVGNGSAGSKALIFNAGASATGSLNMSPTGVRSITFPDTTDTVCLTTLSQTVSNKLLRGDTSPNYFVANADTSKRITFDTTAATTSTTLTVKDNQSTSQTLNFPNITGTDTLSSLALGQTFTGSNVFSTSLTSTGTTQITDTSFVVRAGGDTTKRNNFDISGNTTGITTTFKTQSTSGQSITFPFGSTTDTVVLNNGTLLVNGAKSFNNFTFQDATTASKKITWANSAATASTTLTIAGQQSTSQQLNIPNIAATDTLLTQSATQTVTATRITKRIVAGGSVTTLTPTGDTADIYTGTRTAGATALTVAAPTGTPTDGQPLELIITASSTGATTYTWNAIYVGSTALALPTTGGGTSLVDKFIYQYNTAVTKWQLVGMVQGFS